MTIFEAFENRDYAALWLKEATINGDEVVRKQENLRGVVIKAEGSKIEGLNSETVARMKLFVKPEDIGFDAVELDGVKFVIIEQKEGRNLTTGEIEHFVLTLEERDYGGEG